MEIKLNKKPKKPIIIEGFPGFGLIGTITTEFLIEHLKAEPIGEFVFDEMPPTVVIHKGKVVNPMGVFYDKKSNIVILHTIQNMTGNEWKIANAIEDMANKLKAREIISVEGVSSPIPSRETKVYYYCKKPTGCIQGLAEPLNESIIMGVSAALMLNSEMPFSGFFAETHSKLPDSKAAAKIIEVMDKYLNLKVDYNPLLKQAEEFEKKFKSIIDQTTSASKERDKKALNYVG